MRDKRISVATTPNGQADAVTKSSDGRVYFVEPAIDKMSMEDLLAQLSQHGNDLGDIHYLQSQNGNLFSSSSDETQSLSELSPLTKDVPQEVSWCSEALAQKPDAVNIWIGNEKSVTSIHNDPYENIYTVIRGEKHFVVLPPTDSWALKERYYHHARYERQSPGSLTIVPSDESVPHVRWSSILNPVVSGAFPDEVHPINITLKEGDSLYLPVGWWHYVRQSGLTIALNWWYDAELRGTSWVLMNFLRNTGEIPSENKDVDEASY
ncbi:Clavaminate synthase-like protein [Crepidotus variabilis]|uniref:Clavaminate synthase-like protein n=1 Tax=Crepidotus variabilis TaxID=179855 RepID=A0A9P6ES94_9AGAR|nr:Clavaminate synthase-like protein [Crepidotus variabilis]